MVQENTALRITAVNGRQGGGATFGSSGPTKDANAGLVGSAAFQTIGIPRTSGASYAGCMSVDITKKGAASLGPDQFYDTVDTAVTSLSEDEVRSAGQKRRRPTGRGEPWKPFL